VAATGCSSPQQTPAGTRHDITVRNQFQQCCTYKCAHAAASGCSSPPITHAATRQNGVGRHQ
jgi:hypothetical protein